MTDIACSGCSRRVFLSETALAAAALLLAGCGSDPTAPSTLTGSVRVSDHPALANVNGIALVTVDGSPLAIVRTGADSFVALSRICPHQGNRINQDGGGFLCSGHGARFSATGSWLGGQQTSSMTSYPVSFDAGSGTLTIG